MTQTETLLKNLQSSGVKLSANNGKLRAESLAGELSAETKELLRQHKAEIIQMLKSQTTSLKMLDAETIELINQKANEWDTNGRATANKFKWCEASLF